ncbi:MULTISPECIES: FAD binding domain-containing protein [Bacillaceae]|uniref:FAD binding domain-containing protein n=1 Tax=Bacillaceae TaxID=186817 RepID=UPI00101C177A|nr:FAD binding domain-containing protein [Ectobacillus funiculus]
MLHFNFDYYDPSTITEAVQLFVKLEEERKNPLYYGGGTELLTLGRLNQIFTKAVIDVKRIPECNVLDVKRNSVVVGAALTLTDLAESKVFPFLGETAAVIGDRTSRNQITFGGNLASDIIYREAVLPLLLTDSTFVIAGNEGVRHVPVQQIFKGRLHLNKGEFLVQVKTDVQYTTLPFFIVKKRKSERVDYPLLTLALLKTNTSIRLAVSGLCEFPFRSIAMEKEINNTDLPLEERIERALCCIPAPVIDDIRGSSEYRLFVLRNTLFDGLTYLEGVRTWI